ncbi:Uncharacterised protein [Mannheimia haemolytica]|uniref:Uncharacterized protein n=1 Tax=Mannheimia haemolytica TaxID=75985 RepID=A0A378MVQ5_MANHA|nr:Uncharacterised protein [Mannheimia haemolytica]
MNVNFYVTCIADVMKAGVAKKYCAFIGKIRFVKSLS